MAFDLKKSGKSDPKGPTKFDLTKNKDNEALSSVASGKKKSFPFIWLLLAVVIVGSAIWFLTSNNSGTNQTSDTTENPKKIITANDSANLNDMAITADTNTNSFEKVSSEQNGTESPGTSSGEKNSSNNQKMTDVKDKSSDKKVKTSEGNPIVTSKGDVTSASSKTNKIILNFGFNKADIPGSNPSIDELVKYLNENPNSRISIVGHTDNVGEKGYNWTLSKKRAKVVYDYLICKGISSDRVEYLGKGDQMPIANNETKEGRAQNRRAEYKVLN